MTRYRPDGRLKDVRRPTSEKPDVTVISRFHYVDQRLNCLLAPRILTTSFSSNIEKSVLLIVMERILNFLDVFVIALSVEYLMIMATFVVYILVSFQARHSDQNS